MAKFAEFKTAYLQREIPVMATLTAALKVGQLCTYDGTALAAVGDSTNVAVGQYIVAQSDMTMGDGHVPVERRNYAYSDVVAASSTPKLVALFRVDNVDDLIVKTV